MRLPRFRYERPSDLKGAVAALQGKAEAKPIAGGTDLLVNMKHRVEAPETLVSLRDLHALRGIREERGSTVIGALTTLKTIQDSAVVRQKLPIVAEAAMAVGSYRHQTMGTLGGNLCQNNRCRFFNQPWQWRQARTLCHKAGGEDCHVIGKKNVCYSAYSGDLAPALLVLDATVRAFGPAGSRELPLCELYSGDGVRPLTLQPGEIVTEVVIPEEAASGRARYEKFSLRGALDFAIVGAAVWRRNGTVRAAFTAVDRAPVRASDLEAAASGRELTEEVARELAPLAAKAARVAPTTIHPITFKRDLMASLFLKALRALS